MKKSIYLLLCAAVAVLGTSCQKDDLKSVSSAKEQIVLSLADASIDMSVSTKATEISAMPSSLYLARTSGTWKNETSENESSTFTITDSKIATGWYQTSIPTAYNYYVSNVAMTFAAGGSTIVADNAMDVIAGCTQTATDSGTPSVSLDHIFARTATLTCNPQEGYEVSDVSWKIESKADGTGGTKGTYNIATKAWSGVTALGQQTFASDSDLYLNPGDYIVTVSYTLSKGSYSESFTKSGIVNLVAGKKNSITCTAVGGDAAGIDLGVTLTGWGSNSCTLTFSGIKKIQNNFEIKQ